MLGSLESVPHATNNKAQIGKIHFTVLVYHKVVNNAGTLQGGCHCGAVRFEVTVERWEVLQCNCSICTKKGYLHLITEKHQFELLQGADSLREYRYNTKQARHLFCTTCGVQSFYVPRSHPEGYSVNLRCLDGNPLERFQVIPFDGANWETAYDALNGEQ